jgi:hypothetical protein
MLCDCSCSASPKCRHLTEGGGHALDHCIVATQRRGSLIDIDEFRQHLIGGLA